LHEVPNGQADAVSAKKQSILKLIDQLFSKEFAELEISKHMNVISARFTDKYKY
jgi:hypothetical protein